VRLQSEQAKGSPVEVCRGDAAIEIVFVTLKFANAVGEVLTAGPIPSGGALLPFVYYIPEASPNSAILR
jgi:hypothetical protein